jgi:hypothetical protein
MENLFFTALKMKGTRFGYSVVWFFLSRLKTLKGTGLILKRGRFPRAFDGIELAFTLILIEQQ